MLRSFRLRETRRQEEADNGCRLPPKSRITTPLWAADGCRDGPPAPPDPGVCGEEFLKRPSRSEHQDRARFSAGPMLGGGEEGGAGGKWHRSHLKDLYKDRVFKGSMPF